jgi:hypothetical protein
MMEVIPDSPLNSNILINSIFPLVNFFIISSFFDEVELIEMINWKYRYPKRMPNDFIFQLSDVYI